MSTDNFGSLGADFFIKTYNKGSTMSQADLDALVQYVQLTTTILAIGDFTPNEQDSVWMILERVDVPSAPGYTVTNNTDVTMTSGGMVTIDSIPWSKITGKPTLFTANQTVNTSDSVSFNRLTVTGASGIEGGEIQLAKAPNSTIAGDVIIDVYENKLRFFEGGGNGRGFYLDLTTGANNTSTNIMSGGSSGAQGPKGDTGDTGAAGAQGPAGPKGDTGDAGADGAPGAQGPAGSDGADGASAYEVAVANGFIGNQAAWLASLVGATGQNGTNGTNGNDGADGAAGADGNPGVGVPTGGTVGQVLAKVDGTDYNTEWVTQTGGSGATALSGLSDVSLEGPIEGSVLTWNNSQNHWENRDIPVATQITNTNGDGATYAVSVGTDGVITMTTARGGIEFGALPEVGGTTHLHIMRPAGQNSSSDLYFGDDYNYVKLPGLYGIDPNAQQGVEIGSSLNEGAVSVWKFGTDGHLTLPAGGDIKDSTGTSVLGGGSANTGNITFSGNNITGSGGARLRSLNTTTTASYNFTPGNSDYSTAVWDGTGITFNDPTQAIYDAIWALTNFSTIEIQVGSTWFTVTSSGSSTPGMPQAPTLWVNESAVGGPLNIDVVDITINQGTESFVEIDGTDFEVDVQDDIRMYGNDTFLLSNRSTSDPIRIETNDGSHQWAFNSEGHLILPDGGDIKNDNGNSLLFSGSYNDLSDTPSLFSGDYNDLNNKPTIRIAVATGSGPGGNLQADSLALAGLNPVTDIPSTWGGDLILQGGVGGANGDLYGEVRIKSGQIGANYEWHFTTDKKIKLPAGGDIVDSTGASVLDNPDPRILTSDSPTPYVNGFPSTAESAIDLTKQLATLGDGEFTLANGAENQILYLAHIGSVRGNCYITFASVRYYTNGVTSSNFRAAPFGSGSSQICIFTNGAWSVSFT